MGKSMKGLRKAIAIDVIIRFTKELVKTAKQFEKAQKQLKSWK